MDGCDPAAPAQAISGLTEEQITEAHAYAYGGAVIQDLGYYPFGSTEFSDLVHYVRSGDFVRELLLESQDVNEYAFALGALSHYASDIAGHPAVNQAVAIEYPKLRAKYGKSVRYAQDKTAHLKTEFGFDTVQVAKNRYASQQYHDFIGFQVSKSLLERVFPVVYGMPLKDVLTHEDMAVGSYRFAVSRMIPRMTQVALQTHKKDLMHETPDFAKRKFLYRLSRSDYEKQWGKDYKKPGVGTRILSTILLRYMPKVGPFKGMAFNNPTPQTEDLYFKSINTTVDHYRVFLEELRNDKLVLPNCDLDTGQATDAGRILSHRRRLCKVACPVVRTEVQSDVARIARQHSAVLFRPHRRNRDKKGPGSLAKRTDVFGPTEIRVAGADSGGWFCPVSRPSKK